MKLLEIGKEHKMEDHVYGHKNQKEHLNFFLC